MYKKILSSLFIIFISQSILFSQDNCEGLSQDECTEFLSCSWSIIAMPNGIFEMCIESNDDGGWEEVDICSEFPPDVCVTMPFCELTADDGCIMADFGDDGGDWSDDSTGWNDDGGWEEVDICSEFPPDVCVTMPFCELTADDGCIMADFGDDGGDWSCSDIDNPYECFAMDCEWLGSNNTPVGGSCIEGDWEDGCSGLSQEDCEWLDYCEWQWGDSITEEGSCGESDNNDNIFFSGHVFGNMGPMLPAFEHLAGAIVKLYGGFTGGLLAEIESNEEGYFEFGDVATAAFAYSVHADGYLAIEGNLYDLCNNPNTTECFPIYTEFFLDPNNDDDGCFEDGEWYGYGQELFVSDCEYLECTPNGWIGPFTLNNDDCSNNNDWECSDLEYQDCQTVDYCEWITDSYNSNSWGSCVEIGGNNDDPPECLMDCEGIEGINPDEDPYEACDLIITLFGFDPGFSSCMNDCDDETMLFINEFVEACYECLENEDLDCADIFDDEDDCDPNQMCDQVETCIDGLLYPTSCGPDNCDEPIGECNGGGNDGVLYGYVEYIWGDAIEMVGGAHILIQSVDPDSSNIEIYETLTNDWGSYEISLPPGAYMVTASAYEDSETHDIFIEGGHEHELNFQLGEWSWPEPQAIFSLGDGTGTQEGFTVPLYLQTDSPVSGLQFAVMPEYAGGGFWFTPSELESTNDCFSASFNDVYSQLWGIMFSLEGCVYEPGEHHVANLSFTVAAGSTVPPGTDVHLVFNYTLVSDPDANEVPSSGEGSMVTFGQLGDVNSDGAINVVDIVNMVNFALQIDEPTEYESWAADLNQDGNINVLDIVSVVNIILYEDDLQRSDSGDAEIYYNGKEVHIEGIDVAGFQIEFSDDIDINQIQIPNGWASKSHGHSILAYALEGNLLNGRSIIKLNQSTEIIELILVDANGESIMASIDILPNVVSLKGNFPNPFNPETSISYTLSHDSQVMLSVYDLSGRLVETLVEGQQYPGEFLVSWSAHSLPSGMYIARLMVDGESFTQKMMLMK